MRQDFRDESAEQTACEHARQDLAEQRQIAVEYLRDAVHAVAHIEAHAHEPLTLEDIAAAAGMSGRGLQHAFRRTLDMTPMEYVRRVRLSAAHEELRSGTAVSVSDVAKRWGFSSASRFARYHREHYGQNPAQVARMFWGVAFGLAVAHGVSARPFEHTAIAQ